ncbi:MAG TPA: succinate dehydrogenase, cytochrome b556 subunit [Paracoccaceae bacterium]|nr:succinate dehydrogenase, cytochrome b556 subunit [Paracoccaceae bacterium]
MADVNRGKRPLSPFMIGPHYRPQITSVMSIANRITGVFMTLGAVMIVWWFAAAATGPESFARADGFLTHWFIVIFIWLPLLLSFWYHFVNGMRHLMWDTGYGMTLPDVYTSGYITLAATALLSLFTLVFALF